MHADGATGTRHIGEKHRGEQGRVVRRQRLALALTLPSSPPPPPHPAAAVRVAHSMR